MSVPNDVAALISEGSRCRRMQRRIWSLPGEPLVGVVSAHERSAWDAYMRQATWIDGQVHQIRAHLVVSAQS